MNEEDIEILEAIENDLKTIDLYKNTYDIKYSKLLDLYNKQKENNKKLQEGYDKRVKEILKLEQRIEELEEIEEEHRKENGKLRANIKELKKDKLDLTRKYNVVKMKDVREELVGMSDELTKSKVKLEMLNNIIDIAYVSKSKIKEKIEEISGMLEVGNIEREIYNRGEYAIEVLLELLEEQEDK